MGEIETKNMPKPEAVPARPKTRTIVLSQKNGDMVTVEPEDEDRFALTAQNAIRTLQDAKRQQDAIKSAIATFKSDFVSPLMTWCKSHASKVAQVVVPAPTTHIQIFVVTKSPEYDFELSEELSALEMELAQKWRVSIIQLPSVEECEKNTFFDISDALEFYAQLETAS